MRATAIGALCALAGLALAACGGDEEARTRTVTVAAEPAGETAPPAPQSTAGGGGTATAASDPGTELAAGEGGKDGHRFRFALTGLERSGATVVASARVEILSAEEDASIQVSDVFADGEYQPLTDGKREEAFVFDGIALVDGRSRKKYLVARDETGRCVCSNNLSAVFVKPDAPVALQATLSAPPPEATKVDVLVPNVRTFTDVPIAG